MGVPAFLVPVAHDPEATVSDLQPTPAFLNYITDESFRRSLVSDHREMTAAVETQSWKAVHVLAGSLVEAILVDYLYGRTTDTKQREAILNYPLGEAIKECKAAGVLNAEAEALCVVVRNYRNLIHPGRVKRLDQEITQERAVVAVNLVTMVAEAVAKKQKETYGYTGEQILAKITHDPKAFPSLIQSLLAKVGPHEKERLLFKLLPQENFDLRLISDSGESTTDFPHLPARLKCIRQCYIYIIQQAADDVKKRAVREYVSVLHDGTELDRRYYESGFLNRFIGSIADPADREIIKNHLFDVLRRGASEDMLHNTAWLGSWVNENDFWRVTYAFLGPHDAPRGLVRSWTTDFYEHMGLDLCKQYRDHLQRQAQLSENEEYGGSPDHAARLRDLLSIPWYSL